MVNGISDGFDFYFNVDTMQQSWQLPESDELDPSLLTHADIQVPCSYLSIWLIAGLHIHTHTHPFNGPLCGTTQVSRYQKGKTNLDFTKARDSE